MKKNEISEIQKKETKITNEKQRYPARSGAQKSGVLQRFANNNVFDGIEHDAHGLGVRGAGDVRVNLFVCKKDNNLENLMSSNAGSMKQRQIVLGVRL
jgi:hypothetical protein